MLRARVKSFLANATFHTGLFRAWLTCIPKDRFLVLMYHRVIPRSEGGRFLQPGMYVEPKTFEVHLRFLKRYFDVRPVNDLPAEECPKKPSGKIKHTCYLTFDDGWEDFYRYAYPLLVKYQIPAMVFLPTGFIGTTRRFWTERLGHLCASSEQRGTFSALREFALQTLPLSDGIAGSGTDFLEALIRHLKTYRLKEIETVLEELEAHFSNGAAHEGRDFLRWEEIKEMQRSGLVTFGSHTESHMLLNTLSDEEVAYELVNSKRAILARRASAISNLSFCYPNGNYNAVAIAALDRVGYRCGFTTRSGWNTPATSRFELKRVGVHQDIAASEALLAYRIFSAATMCRL